MKLKYFILSLCCVATVFSTNAQSKSDSISHSKIQPIYRAEAGYFQQSRAGNRSNTTHYYGMRLGGNVEFPLKYNFGIQTGLNYNFSKGDKTQYYVTPKDTAKYTYSNHTLNVPLRVTYTLPIFWKLKLFAYAGPVFSVGLAEPTTLTARKTLWVKSGDYDAYTDKENRLNVAGVEANPQWETDALNRFNIQLGAGGGVQWRNLRVKSGYDWGVLNVSKNKNASQRTKGWALSLEYEF